MSGINTALMTAYDLAFQVSPIILTGGDMTKVPGGGLPIIALVGQAASALVGALSKGFSTTDFYARFVPLAGSTVIANSVATYPFANQSVAANAIITQPLTISLQMIAPAKAASGYLSKLAVFSALRESLYNHNVSGGTYTIATPSYLYTNCLMTQMTDVTSGEGHQQQIMWQLDFLQPLVSSSQAQALMVGVINRATNGSVSNGALTGPQAGMLPGALTGISQQSASIVNALSLPVPGV